jgi:heterodisulfide reductase subunit A-like polyferredoxin
VTREARAYSVLRLNNERAGFEPTEPPCTPAGIYQLPKAADKNNIETLILAGCSPEKHSAAYNLNCKCFDCGDPMVGLQFARGECRNYFKDMVRKTADIQDVLPLRHLRG